MKNNLLICLIVCTSLLSVSCVRTTTVSGNSLTTENSLRAADRKDKQAEALETYIKLGLGYLREGNRDGARLHLKKALETDPRSGMAHNGMALLYQMDKEDQLAEQHFEKALMLEPDLTAARNNYAVFLMRKDRYQEAYEHLLRAAADLEYQRRSRVHLTLGQAAMQLGKKEEAMAAWEKAINLNPQMAPAYLALAQEYFEKRELPLAKRYLDRYSELAGPRASALWLGIRLAAVFENEDGVASKALALEKMFPYSQEYLDYKAWAKARTGD
ncbi:MAG TPA: type IV pilus biogenesis/stability protein PilW [Porticoccaceae bacterium]|nr:type IV pilus biogenesis/stability protein PilW [Porticoccaceae bacterium]HCO60543.1 type IV pilus biogenesis/stability protein PilW [Porticoccaceae bacterium]